MKEKIVELIDHHKLACEELSDLINELFILKNKSSNQEDIDALNQTIWCYTNEKSYRKVFINQLEDLI